MKKRARRFLTIYLPALLLLGLSARAEDRTMARAPLPPLPASPAEAQPGPDSAPAQASDQAHDAVHPEWAANDRPKHVRASRRKNAQAGRAKHQRQPAELPPEGTYGRATVLSPPRQVSPPRPEYGSRGGRAPSPNDIVSAEGSPTGGSGNVPYPANQRRFTYPWPYGSPQAGGFVPALPGAPPPPFGYYPNYPPPYFSSVTPYRYP
jgi:hypothetical protein